MGFDRQVEKPLLSSNFISTSANLQQKSRSQENSQQNNSNNQLLSPNLESRQKLTQYGPDLSNIAVSYDRVPIQTKLTVGKPADKYEPEAAPQSGSLRDRVSEQVMNISQPIQRQEMEEDEARAKPLANAITPLVQRQEMEEDEAQMKPEIQRQENEEEPEEV